MTSSSDKHAELEAALRQHTHCEVHFDSISRHIYSVDASIYEVLPLGVAIPTNIEDLQKAVQLAGSLGISIIPRGAATGITGGCLGAGLILDTSKYLTRILALDLPAKKVTCQPGVIQDELNRFLRPHGLRLGPDTSTGDRATLGGMAANNAAGARSLIYGQMVDAVEEIELILVSGQKLPFGSVSEEQWRAKLALPNEEGAIYRAAEEIRTQQAGAIRAHFPPLPRRVSGYNLQHLLGPFPLNLAKLIVGSEGSLGVISSLTLKLVEKPRYQELCLLRFDNILEAMERVPALLQEKPSALELIDDKILAAAREAPSLQGKLHGLMATPAVVLMLEFQEPKAEQLVKRFPELPSDIIREESAMQHIYEIRKSGLGLLLSKRSYSRAIAFIEDLAVPPGALLTFMQRFLSYLHSKGKEAGIYGHVGAGCLHIRPYMDLRSPAEIALMQEIMRDTAVMVRDVGGAMSGEHGDGLIRSWLNESLYGAEIVTAFQKLKTAFDPLGLMNPHKVVTPLPVDQNLRQPPRKEPSTFLSLSQEGGLSLFGRPLQRQWLVPQKPRGDVPLLSSHP